MPRGVIPGLTRDPERWIAGQARNDNDRHCSRYFRIADFGRKALQTASSVSR